MNVLIIGGTGVISTSIVDRLHDLSHKVTIVNRGLSKIRCRVKPEIIIADKTKQDDFRKALEGRKFDAVIDMTCQKAEDTAFILETLGDGNCHFVFTSSVAVYKRPVKKNPITEDSPRFTQGDFFPYGFNKAEMERFLEGKMKEQRITIIRPSLTYGIGCRNVGVMRNNYGIVQRMLKGKSLIVFGDGTNPWAWTFAPDLAKAFAGVLQREKCFGQIYHAVNGDTRIWDDLYLEFGKRLKVEPKLIHISTEMLLKAGNDPFLNLAQEKMYPGIFDNAKINRDVPEFICDYSLDKIVAALCEWYDSDPDARIVDQERDKLEDTIIERYYRCLDIMAGN